MKFTKTHNDWNGQFLETVSIEIKEDVQIDDVLETFTRFLRAVGYDFDGQVQIVGDEDQFDPLDDDQDWNLEEDWDDDGDDKNEMIPAFEGPIEGFLNSHDSTYPTPSEAWPFPLSTKP
jgi:hypothetical protein